MTSEEATIVQDSEPALRMNGDVNPKKATETKRVLACGTCRKRKLKCDSKRPKCSTCARLGHPCEYDEVRKKSGPKRGYVKSLEARLNQLESLLDSNREPTSSAPVATQPLPTTTQDAAPSTSAMTEEVNNPAPLTEVVPQAEMMTDNDIGLLTDFGAMSGTDFSWDLISLGLEEPLPSQDVMDDLYQIFFEKVHSSVPQLHRPRFMTSLNMSPSLRPPVCLRYIIFAHACSVEPRYSASAEQFYNKARKYIETDEMRGHGESFITVAHAQTWNLIATYEFKHMYFPRAWLSVGRAGRLVQMLGLHRQDRAGLDVKQTLGPAKDWIEREERRRTFWVAYCQDRYASIGTGWPMIMDESDIMTNLPASDNAYLNGHPEQTPMLPDIMSGDGLGTLSPYGSVILLTTLFGRNLTHLHRHSADDNDDNLSGEFWRRHRTLDNIILNTALSLPSHLRLPQGISDPNVVFCNMNVHTSTICLHQAAIFKADKHKLASQISSESKRRCLVAADQITSIMRMICHQDLSGLNPFIAFCLYVAARVFVQYLKFKRDDQTVRSSLIFLLNAMQALKNNNPLTESFLVQLDVDLEGSGLDIPSPMTGMKFAHRPPGEIPANTDSIKCSPLFEIRDSMAKEAARVAPTVPMQSEFRASDFETPNYFNSSFDQTGGLRNNSSGGLIVEEMSSRSHSNQHTPSSSNIHGSTSSHTSPLSDGQHFNVSSSKSNSIKIQEMFSPSVHNAAPAGAILGDFNMEMEPETSRRQSEAETQDLRPGQNQLPSETINFNFGGTGLTPGPTGFTPGPTGSGMTPGHTGMTPGNPGMTPFSDWQNMNMLDNMNTTGWDFGR